LAGILATQAARATGGRCPLDGRRYP